MIYFIGEDSLLNNELYTPSTVEECIAYFSDKKSIAVDTETKGRNPYTKRILSLQLGDPDNQWVIDCRTTDIRQFKELLESKKLLLHNAKFDYKFLKHAGITIEDIWDTMLAECVLYCGHEAHGYSLQAVTERYLDIHLSKDTRGDFYKIESEPFTDKQVEYAALDVTYLHKIAEAQFKELEKYGLLYAADLEFKVTKAFADVEYNGMYLDPESWGHNAVAFEQKVLDLTYELDEIIKASGLKYPVVSFGEDLFGEKIRELKINYNSPQQIKTLLSDLGISVENTNNRTLVTSKSRHAFIPKLIEYREASKRANTYGQAFLDNINPATGRIHSDFWQVLNTYRVSSNNPNLQNIPSTNEFRNCFKPRPGYKWVSIDYASQELRLMADFSEEPGFIDVLNRGEDLHCYAGSMMFKRTITKEDKDLRTKAKTINFGKP